MNNTSTQQPDLFSPIKVGAVPLKNRIAMAPLTRNRAGDGLVPTEMNVEYYRQRASAGLIISEGAQIAREGIGYPGTPGIHSAEQVEGWKKVTKAVHENSGKIFLQLWHCGRVSHSSLLPGNMLPWAPSAIKPVGEVLTYAGTKPYETPHAMAPTATCPISSSVTGPISVLIDMAAASKTAPDFCWQWPTKCAGSGAPIVSACACPPYSRSTISATATPRPLSATRSRH